MSQIAAYKAFLPGRHDGVFFTRRQYASHLPLVLSLGILLSACASGPDYQRPTIESPAQFKESSGWVRAEQLVMPAMGDWWTVFGDEVLNHLEPRVVNANQSLQASYFSYQQALALVDSARAAEFPTLSATVSSSRSATGTTTATGAPGVAFTTATQTAGLTMSWAPDFWGKVGRQVEANAANAQASLETLRAAQLGLQSTLAQNYFQIRQLDGQIALAQDTVSAYAKSLALTQNRYVSGVSTQADVAQAKLQLANSRVQLNVLSAQRAQLEHAIAVLIGVPPSNFSLPPRLKLPKPQEFPVGVPSQLLLRRPDLLAVERQVAAANAQIGVAKSAYFPALTLSAQSGYRGTSSFADLFSVSNLFWSVGPSLAETLFDGGARAALTSQNKSAYQQMVAQYRQLSLQAFQQVEDQLTALSALADESKLQQDAVAAADESLRLATNQYKAGMVSYLNVIVAQTASYTARNGAIQISGQRLVADVALIQALGGGANVEQVQQNQSPQ